uniref:Tropinone reductase n=1 Tax=Eucampia antarctica TaxID=49252 RepID=A0A7S2S8K7_9STRA|mmetsp:Transcript_4626/g.4382  ORF Transcript_4626/g.4382 Transcript_4626/m.4382 type:complete len:279 (+) Transcript_4626:54-890(+)
MNSILSSWSLESKSFLVTGGTKGIGFATAQSLLAHGAGTVFICARGDVTDVIATLKSGLPEESKSQVLGLSCDISTKEGRYMLVDAVKNAMDDKLDGLVNNVGMNIMKDVTKQTEEEYDQMMRTNVDSAYFLCKNFKNMLANAAKEKGSAAIVNVASAAGVQSSGTGAVYGMSKAAMIHFSKILACEWAKFNIRVNAVAPWMTMTPMLQDAVKDNPRQLDKVTAWTPMHRLSTADDVAGPITFLLMPASGYITGVCIPIDGGLSAQGFDGPCVTPPDN